jgi:hypothetical protein
MGKLERAKIYQLKGAGDKDDKEDPAGIDVCFNPKEYSLEKSVDWSSEKAKSEAPLPEYKEPKAMTLSLTLQFDTYEERVSVRDRFVRRLEKLALMRGQLKKKMSADEKKAAAPPVILFVWGKFNFKGVIESLNQKYTMFLSDGTPVRAEVALKIRNVLKRDIDEGTEIKRSTQAKTYTVEDGDRLDLIAAKELGSASRWVEIAAENNIDDPMRELKKGDTLKIPE